MVSIKFLNNKISDALNLAYEAAMITSTNDYSNPCLKLINHEWIADILWFQGKYIEALTEHETALKYLQSVKDDYYHAHILWKVVNSYITILSSSQLSEKVFFHCCECCEKILDSLKKERVYINQPEKREFIANLEIEILRKKSKNQCLIISNLKDKCNELNSNIINTLLNRTSNFLGKYGPYIMLCAVCYIAGGAVNADIRIGNRIKINIEELKQVPGAVVKL